jgi:hypothetical protein
MGTSATAALQHSSDDPWNPPFQANSSNAMELSFCQLVQELGGE